MAKTPKPAKPPRIPWIALQPKAIQRVVSRRGGYANVNRYRWTPEQAKAARRLTKRHPVKVKEEEGEP